MKTQLIILEQGNILISDEDFTSQEWFYSPALRSPQIGVSSNRERGFLKIIASENPRYGLPSINYNGLEEELSIVDIEELAENRRNSIGWSKETKMQFNHGFIEGFKNAQSLNDKKFSLGDLKRAIEFAREEDGLSDNSMSYDYSEEDIIKLIQQPKVFDVEVTMQTLWLNKGDKWQPFPDDGASKRKRIPEIINNKIKIWKIL